MALAPAQGDLHCVARGRSRGEAGLVLRLPLDDGHDAARMVDVHDIQADEGVLHPEGPGAIPVPLEQHGLVLAHFLAPHHAFHELAERLRNLHADGRHRGLALEARVALHKVQRGVRAELRRRRLVAHAALPAVCLLPQHAGAGLPEAGEHQQGGEAERWPHVAWHRAEAARVVVSGCGALLRWRGAQPRAAHPPRGPARRIPCTGGRA
mmetsp:Transcript_24718/g.65148  ORF Transcript_24718/g.65148 Transcript_24718/m.65148 type:complete len:209 (+) Transcript_24718:261-887(+)